VRSVAVDVREHLAGDAARAAAGEVDAAALGPVGQRHLERLDVPRPRVEFDRVFAKGIADKATGPFDEGIVKPVGGGGDADVVRAGGLGDEFQVRVDSPLDLVV